MLVLTNLDLNKNQLLNVTLQQLPTAPTNPVEGQLYYNTGQDRAFIYNGTEWVAMDGVGATMTASDIVNAINASSFVIQEGNLDLADVYAEIGTKETPAGAAAKASTAESNANDYTDGKVSDLVGSAPAILDTLEEIAQALGDDPNFATTILTRLADKTKKYTATIGDAAATQFVVTHDLGSRDCTVSIRESGSPYNLVYTTVEYTSENTITVRFAQPPAANAYTVTVIG